MRMIAILCAAALAGCQTPTSQSPVADPVLTADRVTLSHLQERVDTGYIRPFAAGDVDLWLEIFDENVVGLHNRMPAMEGREALRQFGSFVSQNLTIAEMKVVLSGLRQEGDLAYTWGTYQSRLLMRESGEPMPGHSENGKVLFVWKLQPDGVWKIAVDMGNELPKQGESK